MPRASTRIRCDWREEVIEAGERYVEGVMNGRYCSERCAREAAREYGG